jgi:hypothetical protein
LYIVFKVYEIPEKLYPVSFFSNIPQFVHTSNVYTTLFKESNTEL